MLQSYEMALYLECTSITTQSQVCEDLTATMLVCANVAICTRSNRKIILILQSQENWNIFTLFA